MEVIVAIDGGGSRTRCLVVDRAGRVVGEGTSGPSNHLLIDRNTVTHSLESAVEAALANAGLERKRVVCVSAGLAGVDYDGCGAEEMKRLFVGLGFQNPVVNGDMVIAHAGALGTRSGVVALSGTGSCVLGIGSNGERVKVGGWGPIYGDEGSAYRIGALSLRAAARAYDRRGPETALVQSLTRALGAKDFQETAARVYTDDMSPREIAALCRVAYQTAEAGDEVAREIFVQAAGELVESVNVALRLLDLSKKVVSYQGAVLESCHLLRQQFVDQLQQNDRVVVTPPKSEPVIGAYLLGRKALNW